MDLSIGVNLGPLPILSEVTPVLDVWEVAPLRQERTKSRPCSWCPVRLFPLMIWDCFQNPSYLNSFLGSQFILEFQKQAHLSLCYSSIATYIWNDFIGHFEHFESDTSSCAYKSRLPLMSRVARCPWKKILTQLQMVQFCFCFAHAIYVGIICGPEQGTQSPSRLEGMNGLWNYILYWHTEVVGVIDVFLPLRISALPWSWYLPPGPHCRSGFCSVTLSVRKKYGICEQTPK